MKITIMKQTRGWKRNRKPLDFTVIFGALVTFVNENLSQAFSELWKKKLLPHNILIVEYLKVERAPKSLVAQDLGDYPEEFCYWMDFICCDLDCKESLNQLHDES